jgi:cytochrome d ubiquinol oxidase subunit I
MEDLLSARLQMAVSLGFHIIFACIGMVMPFLMAFAHWRWLRTGQNVYLDLTKTWSKGVAIFFATGAVSGTVLSFELGLLWPEFMRHAGPVIGMPFSWEGTAFFIEAIARWACSSTDGTASTSGCTGAPAWWWACRE